MNERYMFRGKRVDNGEWETGFLVIERLHCSDAKHFITDKMTGYHTPIDPDTIGQCTGLRDKNGVLIFEGDMVRYSNQHETLEGSVQWCNCQWVFRLTNGVFKLFDNIVVEIIGNIYDHPEGE